MFGGFAPLPLRLTGGQPDEAWSAAQMLRMAGDVASASRTLPFARVTVTRGTGGASPVLVAADCRAPDVTVSVTGDHPDPVVITFDAAPPDESEDQHTLALRTAIVSRHNSNDPALVTVSAPNAVTVDPDDSAACNFTVVVYGHWHQARAEDYGGIAGKQNTRTETTPYAWNWYRDVGATLGSSFGIGMTGLLHSRKVAYARALAAAQRAEERVRCGSTPDTATITLQDWATALDVPTAGDDPNWLIRQRCSVLYQAQNGGAIPSLEVACQQLLGSRYVSIVTVDEDDDPPNWPVTWDLGGGVWCESRRRIFVDVDPPGDVNDREFANLTGLQLIKLLDRMTPASVQFDWTSSATSGFYLDISYLDFTGL